MFYLHTIEVDRFVEPYEMFSAWTEHAQKKVSQEMKLFFII